MREEHGGNEYLERDPEYDAMVSIAASGRMVFPDAKGHVDPRFGEGWEPTGQSEFVVKPCTYDGVERPVLYWQSGDLLERIYFPHAFSFHPSAISQPASHSSPPSINLRSGRIFVVDTGWRTNSPPSRLLPDDPNRPGMKINVAPEDIDPINFDVAHGHGPAIVDVIKQVGGPNVEVHLRQVRYSGTMSGIALFTHPTGAIVRGFTEDALLATLVALRSELQRGDVLNLSLGTIDCPDAIGTKDPIGTWLRQVTNQGVTVAVAAGNHGTHVPSWPAAYETGIDQVQSIPGVHAVGSGTPSMPDDFSARGNWVQNWEDGTNVLYDTSFEWTGTSFAAPQFAVSLLGTPAGSDGSGGVLVPGGIADAQAPSAANPSSVPAGGLVGRLVASVMQFFRGMR